MIASIVENGGIISFISVIANWGFYIFIQIIGVLLVGIKILINYVGELVATKTVVVGNKDKPNIATRDYVRPNTIDGRHIIYHRNKHTYRSRNYVPNMYFSKRRCDWDFCRTWFK
ncbi:hypothetical protein CEXT_660821 [Caerostris extrusa]|uniref:Uncharacterized protein n=1 Tax=Caerostris extrusa TaxID=172846 RepID=A0AAV4SDL8_CAEEX|nr:hypothetical protein CEXT_660821 [Caerostris extrusa]